MNKLFNQHPNGTFNKLTYMEHAIFSIYNSFNLIISGIIGIIHGIFPFLFPFYTSSVVIKSFINIITSQRHNNELLYYFNKYDNNTVLEFVFDDNGNIIDKNNKNMTILLTINKKYK